MSLSKIIGSVVTIAALALLVPQATAQHDIHRGPPFIDPDGNDADLAQPFVDPTAFPHDFQFFAPAEFGEFGGGPEPNTGWFATADRVYIYMSRPDPGPTPTEGDFTWGNRFEFGYMSPEDYGWFGEFWHIDGPNEFGITEAERVNVINFNDQINSIPGSIYLRDGTVINPPNPMTGQAAQNQGIPRSDQNNPITFDRRYLIRDSVNSAKLTSFELNKSFRLNKLHYGSYFEPFFGFRYMNYKDLWERDTYDRYDELGVPHGQFPPTNIDPTLLITEQFDELTSNFTNHMVGGQFGARWYKRKGRWNLSSEIRAFMFANFQFQQTQLHQELTFYDPPAGSSSAEVLGVFLQDTFSSNNTTSFVFGGEVRAEAAYEVTRDVSIRVGVTFMELGNGVGRGADGQGAVGPIQDAAVRVDQNVTMFGTTFGVDFRR